MFYSIWISLHSVHLAVATPTRFVGLQNFIRVLRDSAFRQSAGVTALYTVEVTLLALIIALGSALVLNETFKGKGIVMSLAVLPWALSTYAAAVLWRYLFSVDVGFFNAVLLHLGLRQSPINFMTKEFALTGVAIAHAWNIAPLGIYLFLATLQVIPEDLYRMAKLDRLGPLGRFRHVMMPYLQLPLLLYIFLTTGAAVQTFDVIYFMTSGGPARATLAIGYEIYVQILRNLAYSFGAAESWLLILISMAISTGYVLVLMRQRGKVL